MGIFGKMRAAEPEPESRARREWKEAAAEFNRRGQVLRVECEPNRTFGFKAWKLAMDETHIFLLPDLDPERADDETLLKAFPLSLRRTQADVQLLPVEPQELSRDGLLTEYRIADLQLRLAGGRVTETLFTAANRGPNLKLLRAWGFPAKPLYGLFDCPERPGYLPLKDGGTLLPKPMLGYYVWREGGNLVFQQRANDLYARARSLKIGFLPVEAIETFETCGEVRTETRITGGTAHMEVRPQSMVELLLTGGRMTTRELEERVEVKQTPVRLENVEHDERYVELRVNHGGVRQTLTFGIAAAEVFERLIPEKARREMPAEGVPAHEPTPAEQLEILANLVDRGYLTREEFDEAKPRLLAKL